MKQVIFEASIANIKGVPSRSVRQVILETDRAQLSPEVRHDLDDLYESQSHVRVLIMSVEDAEKLAGYDDGKDETPNGAHISEGMPWRMYESPRFRKWVHGEYRAKFSEDFSNAVGSNVDPECARGAYKAIHGVQSTKELSQETIEADMKAAADWANG